MNFCSICELFRDNIWFKLVMLLLLLWVTRYNRETPNAIMLSIMSYCKICDLQIIVLTFMKYPIVLILLIN